MKMIPLLGTIIDRHKTEITREVSENTKAITDYNIMMGNLEDPSEGMDESEELSYE